jgi:hypothetical protein
MPSGGRPVSASVGDRKQPCDCRTEYYAVEFRSQQLALVVVLDCAAEIEAKLATNTDSPPRGLVEAADDIDEARSPIALCVESSDSDG